LRREGVYSSQLCKWRKQLDLHGSEALTAQKRGPKPKLDAKDRRIAEQDKRIAKLEAKLALNAQLLELQKKAALILGFDLESDEKP
jgi:transposase